MSSTGAYFSGSEIYPKQIVMIGEVEDGQSLSHIFLASVFFLNQLDTFVLADVLPMFQVVGFEEDSSSKLALHRAEVYHTALGIVFNDLEFPAEHGVMFKFHNTFYSGIPIFMVVSADYEEMYVVVSALIAYGADYHPQGSHLRHSWFKKLIPVPNMSCPQR